MDPFLAEIRLFGFDFEPKGWAFCDGRLISVSQYSALFALLGTIYGGDGVTTFALPDLRCRVPMGMGNGQGLSPHTIGEKGGVENVILSGSQIPAHSHQMMGSADAQSTGNVADNSLGSVPRGVTQGNIYAPGATKQVTMGSSTSVVGSNQAHTNMQPYLGMNYCIALTGEWPSRE